MLYSICNVVVLQGSDCSGVFAVYYLQLRINIAVSSRQYITVQCCAVLYILQCLQSFSQCTVYSVAVSTVSPESPSFPTGQLAG